MSVQQLTNEVAALKTEVAALTKKHNELEDLVKNFISAQSKITEEPLSATGGKHVMLSYNWGLQETVKAVYKELIARGVPVWMDVEGGMHGSINTAMASAVENAHVVVPFMTTAYEGSANCKKELSYADDHRVKIVPVMAENDYKQKGWLGLVTAGMLWIDLRNPAAVKAAVDQLLSEIAAAVPELASKISAPKSIIPYCGNWVGYWLQQGTKGEMECDFSFGETGEISGKGEDQVAKFKWKGTFDSKDRIVSITKTYPTHQIQYEGKASGRKQIAGKWYQVGHTSNNGTFELSLK